MKRILLSALVLFGQQATAEIAIFENGRSLKISGYVAGEDTMQLTLASGGTLTLPIENIERVIDDEVIISPEEVKEILSDSAFPARSWRFDEASEPFYNSKYNETILAAGRKFDVDAALISAIIKVESDYNPRIVSHKGARGLMQLMPATARRFGVTNSFDPVANIYGGTRYLRWLLEHFDRNIDHVVAAYNAGEGNVAKYDGIPPFRETVNYVRKVSRHFQPPAKPTPESVASSR